MIWKDWRTWATPGAVSAASSRVTASASGVAALMRSTSTAGETPGSGRRNRAFTGTVGAWGFTARTAPS
jgi:hypothetical protein